MNPTPDIHFSLSDTPDGDRVDAEYCIKTIQAFADDGNLEQVTAWGLFAAKMLMDCEVDIAYLRSRKDAALTGQGLFAVRPADDEDEPAHIAMSLMLSILKKGA